MPPLKGFDKLLYFIPLLFSACGGSSGSSPPPASLEPTLASIQEEVFNKSCTFTACHNEASAQGDLELTEGASFSQLINVPADDANANAGGKLRVVPGDPDASFLIQKLEGPETGEGELMPEDQGALHPDTIAIIRQWITEGAQNN